MIKEIWKVRDYVDIRWRYFLIGMVFMGLNAMLNGISIFSIVPLLDKVIAGKKVILPEKLPVYVGVRLDPIVNFLNTLPPSSLLKYLITFILITIALKGSFSYLNQYYFTLFGLHLVTDIRNRMYKKTTALSMDFFVYGKAGEITSRLLYDVHLFAGIFQSQIPQIIFQGTLAVVYLVIVFTIDWQMAFLAMLIFPPILYPIYRTGKRLKELGRRIQVSYGKIGNLVHEGVYAQQIIKAYNQEEGMSKRFCDENSRILRTVIACTKRVLLISPFTEIISVLGTSGLLYYGANKVMEGSLSSGFLFLFFVALFSLISPFKNIGTTYGKLKQNSSALPRIFSFLETKVSVVDTGKDVFSGLREGIEFQGVCFSYGKKQVLQDITFSLKKGERLGIVGPTGVGKTSLIGLILRFYEPEKGQILIDGKDIRRYKLSTLREHIGFVPQEPILFNDTLTRNISLSESPDMERVKKAAEIVGISDFIESLPNGYDTIAGDRGMSFSGGQKQLICVARAIYRNPEVIILDEATASLDSQSEKALQEAMERIMGGRTVFIIAHRLSTLRSVDRIIVLKEGRIVEEGSHNQLVEKKGEYYHFWELQVH
ncbi:MAG: ABC transporter ATP-binding protein/permease [Candidatus Omnitrophica bacterium]|nr:ABC transporter ATP-binding protein/permease [Candidatus Omnitrophota bacterium]